MRWSAGWFGSPGHDRLPRGGQQLPGMSSVWTVGWPEQRRRSVGQAAMALGVIGVCGADDHQLQDALTAVRSGDWRALTRWPGSYLTVARRGETLAVIGDLAEQHPVYWRAEGGGTWWSTSASTLAALDGAPVDPTALAAHLALAQPDILTSSLFRGVQRVPTGHLLLLSPTGARTVRYEPAAYEPVDLAQAASTVRAALTEAVDVRLDGSPVSADLAGLDSTTLVCLAARRGPVTAVTFADARLRDDDLAYAIRTAAVIPQLRHHAVPGSPDTVYYSGLDNLAALPVTDAPNAYAITAAIKRAALDTVAEHQAPGLHFTGAAGDAVLSAASSYLADLLRDRRYRRAANHALTHARLRHTSVCTVLGQAWPAARTDLAGTWRQTAAELRGAAREWLPQAQRPASWTPLLATADWMSPDVRHQLADALTRAADERTDAPRRLADWATRQDLARVGADTIGLSEIAAASHGIEIAAPYLDSEVIRACLAVPADQRGTPGRYKPLLAEAFAGTAVLPDFILSRSTKGGFNALAYQGLCEHAPVLRELLGSSSRLIALGLVTAQPVHGMLYRAATGQPAALGALHLAVAAEVWLRQLEAAPAPWEVASRVAPA